MISRKEARAELMRRGVLELRAARGRLQKVTAADYGRLIDAIDEHIDEFIVASDSVAPPGTLQEPKEGA